jgi:PIN domain nuclease of toxin-antitoxin system
MDLLIDTCAFIWWDSGGTALTAAAANAMQDPGNRLYLSHASIWEMQLKHQKRKLVFEKPLEEIIRGQCSQNRFILFPSNQAIFTV